MSLAREEQNWEKMRGIGSTQMIHKWKVLSTYYINCFQLVIPLPICLQNNHSRKIQRHESNRTYALTSNNWNKKFIDILENVLSNNQHQSDPFQSSLLPCLNGVPNAPLGCISATSFPANPSPPPSAVTFPGSVHSPLTIASSTASGTEATPMPKYPSNSIRRFKLQTLLLVTAALAGFACH